MRNTENTMTVNQASIDGTTTELESYKITFNLISLQTLIDARYITVFGKSPNKVVIKKTL